MQGCPIHAVRPSGRTWSIRRLSFAAAGLGCFGLGGVGAIVPGMPTTIFLLIGSYFLTRSCPVLEDYLLRTRLFRPYAKFVRSTEPMSTRARIIAMSMMWVSICASMLAMLLAGRLGPIFIAIVMTLGLIGTVSILMFRRAPRVAVAAVPAD